jgi:hypothetical protein
MRVSVFIIIIFSLVICCKSVNKNEYKVDRILISKSRCRPLENLSDTGFGKCPEYAISIDKHYNFLLTEGSVNSSKLNCFSGEITENLWDSLNRGIINKLISDTNNYNLNSFRKMLRESGILYDYTGPEYLVILYSNEKIIITLHFIENNVTEYKSLFDRLQILNSEIKLKRIKDTTLIDLNKYLLMPPPFARGQQQVKYKYKYK